MNQKPILYIVCGCSGAGKSTWCHKFIKDNDIRYVSRDEIRFFIVREDEDYFSHENEVFRKFVGTITQTLVDGFDVIADATHLKSSSRKRLTKYVDRITTNYQIIYIYFNVPLEVCKARNAQRNGRARVPEDRLEEMHRNLRKPMLEEDKRAIAIWEIQV